VVPASSDGPAARATLQDIDATAIATQAVRVAVGTIAIAIAVADETIRRTFPTRPQPDEMAPERTDLLAIGTGAALGLTLAAGERLAALVGDTLDALTPLAAWIVSPLASPLGDRLRSSLEVLDARWQEARPGAERAANAFASALVPQVVDAVLEQLDLSEIVSSHVDVDAIVGTVDLDAVADRIDIKRNLARVDLDQIVARLDIDEIVAGVDLDKVAARIDVNAVAESVDVERIVGRIDMAALALDVIDRIDLPEIIRASTAAVASESVRGVRMEGIQADEAISRFVGRILPRRRVLGHEEASSAPEQP